MQTSIPDSFAPRAAPRARPKTECAPEAVLAMSRGEGRHALGAALAAGGWSVTPLDDGWTLLDHLGGARLAGAWTPPALVVLELAVAGPRLGSLFRRLRGLFPELPVLLVGAETEGGGGALLRPPFATRPVLQAVRRALGTLRAW